MDLVRGGGHALVGAAGAVAKETGQRRQRHDAAAHLVGHGDERGRLADGSGEERPDLDESTVVASKASKDAQLTAERVRELAESDQAPAATPDSA